MLNITLSTVAPCQIVRLKRHNADTIAVFAVPRRRPLEFHLSSTSSFHHSTMLSVSTWKKQWQSSGGTVSCRTDLPCIAYSASPTEYVFDNGVTRCKICKRLGAPNLWMNAKDLRQHHKTRLHVQSQPQPRHKIPATSSGETESQGAAAAASASTQ